MRLLCASPNIGCLALFAFVLLSGCGGPGPADHAGPPASTSTSGSGSGSGGTGGGGSDVGNGGSAVTLPDGRVVIADPYFSRPEEGEVVAYSGLNPAIRAEIELVGRLLVRLGAAVDERVDMDFPSWMGNHEREAAVEQVRLGRKLSRAAQARFVIESVADPVVKYHFVDRIPGTCRSGEEVGPAPDGSTVVLGGCNEGDAVWFQKDVFRSMGVTNGDTSDPREQVKWIIHERLHSINSYGHPHYYIADITNGIDVLLDLYKAQRTGLRPVLTIAQQSKLSTLVERIAQFRGLTSDSGRDDRFINDWSLVPNGGGLAHRRSVVDPSAYVGVGSMLGDGGAMGPGSALINSICFLASCSLAEGTTIRDAIISPRTSQRSSTPGELMNRAFSLTLERGASISASSLYLDLPVGVAVVTGVMLGVNTTLEGSVISGVTRLRMDPGSELRQSRIEVDVRDDAVTSIYIGAGAQVKGLNASFRTKPAGAGEQRELVVPAQGALEFPAGPACRLPQMPWLLGRLVLDQAGKLQATCAADGGR
jgi:hypothetical protein